jgi:uncharacterized protein (DUF58 family)
LFLVLSVLASTLFVSWSAGRASLRDLAVTARFPDHIFAGEPAPVIVTLLNRKRLLPSLSILVEARGPLDMPPSIKRRRRKQANNRRPLAYFPYVPHRASAEQRVEQSFARRGHVLITGFELSTRFPFGFFRLRRRLKARDVDIVVYPKLQPADDELHQLPMNAGRVASIRRGFGHDLLALRDYQPQDDLRHIDWKATARSRRLTVREFTSEDERRVTIALDTRRLRDVEEKELFERFERGVTMAASLVGHFLDEGSEVRLVLGNEEGPFGIGVEHLHACLRRLALVMPEGSEQGSSDSETLAVTSDATLPAMIRQRGFVILLTTAPQGSIPATLWRSAHVLYF